MELKTATGFRARYINALNTCVNQIRPRAGSGIVCSQTGQGTIISLSENESLANKMPFSVEPFHDASEPDKIKLKIHYGKTFLLTDNGAIETVINTTDEFIEDDTSESWIATVAESIDTLDTNVSIVIRKNTNTSAYEIAFKSSSTENITAVIAEIDYSEKTNIYQRILGDIYIGGTSSSQVDVYICEITASSSAGLGNFNVNVKTIEGSTIGTGTLILSELALGTQLPSGTQIIGHPCHVHLTGGTK